MIQRSSRGFSRRDALRAGILAGAGAAIASRTRRRAAAAQDLPFSRAMMKETLASADTLAGRGVAAEVIDVVTLKPVDAETIVRSVEKTGRCVIVH